MSGQPPPQFYELYGGLGSSTDAAGLGASDVKLGGLFDSTAISEMTEEFLGNMGNVEGGEDGSGGLLHPSLPPVFEFDQTVLAGEATRKRKIEALHTPSTTTTATTTFTSHMKSRKLQGEEEEEEGNEDEETKLTAEEAAAAVISPQFKAQSDLVASIAEILTSVDQQLKMMKQQQRRVIDGLLANRRDDSDELGGLLKTQNEIGTQITYCESNLQNLNETQILIPNVAFQVYKMIDSFKLNACQLRVFKEEIGQAQLLSRNPGSDPAPPAALMITDQPFPSYLIQGKAIESPIKVSVITGSTVHDLRGLEPVRAELINQDYTPSAGGKGKGKKAGKNAALPSIQYGTEPMEGGVATFTNLMFPKGTRVKTINMSFHATVSVNGHSAQLQSDMTKPFIVMTNHGQAAMAGGRLFKKDTFRDKAEITWPAFANSLQLHYLHVTKQDHLDPERPLSFEDMQFLHTTKFGGKLMINHDDFNRFWRWFGTILRKISNNQKHMQDMWTHGLIYGFITRAETERMLALMQPGSFIIRFSERNAGQLVVVYKNGKEEVRHCLVTEEEEKKSSTLANYLRDMGEDLWCVIQIVWDKKTGQTALVPRHKDEVIAPYYDKQRAASLPFGYDTEIHVQK